ncbi:MAG: hypothetical protein OXI90_07340 [Gammaproteobacteria bacterium]|nr:hypothetical protein [Gammaproteobacteria bacterium]
MSEKSTDSSLGIATIGWILFAVGLVVVAVLGFQAFLEAPLLIKLLLAGIYGGLGLLLVSVLRQRLIERKSDKYLDVDI